MLFSILNINLFQKSSAYVVSLMILHILFYQQYRMWCFDNETAYAAITTYVVLYKPLNTV